jgi:hypothetical protein
VLNVDADELFVYDQMGKKGLAEVQTWLTRVGQERLFTPLIDVYSESDLNDFSADIRPNMKLLFDGKVTKGRPPYTVATTQFGPLLLGGPRKRMMTAIGEKDSPWLTKFALAKWDSKTSYANVHFPYPFDRNAGRSFAALLHLKLLGDFESRVDRAVFEPEYKSYERWLEASKDKTLVSGDISTEYKGPQSLLLVGLIHPAPWRPAWQRGGLLVIRLLVTAALRFIDMLHRYRAE